MTYEEAQRQLQEMRDQVARMMNFVNAKEQELSQQESVLTQGQMPGSYPQNLSYNLQQNLGPMLAPGNVGDINSIIWPFYFTTERPDAPIGPNQVFETGFSVTQEAAFIMMSYTKSVYLIEGDPETWGWLNPNNLPSAPGLSFSLRDGSSSRQLFNTPMNLDAYGHPQFPSKWPRPMMLLPNQVMQIQFFNSHAANSYVPFITAFGYRMRIEDAQKFLSLVYG